jgi:replication factor C small subunit
VEKYRARSLEELEGQPVATNIAAGIIERGLPMNVLLAGPAGTGKTTTAHIIIDEVLGARARRNFKEVNASDQLRMDYVRGPLKDFVTQASLGGGLKVVLLEEADNIPPDAQSALRRQIERSWRGCRFILTCNYPSNIIDPIRSRCVTVRFAPAAAAAVEQVAARILKCEYGNLDVDIPSLAETLRDATGGDMRLVINALQACDINAPEESIHALLGMVRPITLRAITTLIESGKFAKILSKLNVMDRVNPAHFLGQLSDWSARDLGLEGEALASACRTVADYDRRLSGAGAQEEQLMGLIARLCLLAGGEL